MILTIKGEKVGIIPDDFKCPCVGFNADKGAWDKECKVFAFTGWYCPYAAFPYLRDRRFNRDCQFAPPQIWRDMKNQKERIEHWLEERA